MLNVIGAGLPRTGTLSLKAALERFGLGPCFHMFEILRDPALLERWSPLVSGDPVSWEQVFEGYRSTLDWPASCFWQEQAEAFPDAKVILTVRDPRRWYASYIAMLSSDAHAAAFQGGLGERLHPLFSLIYRRTFGPLAEGALEEAQAVAAFERHVEKVRQSVPAERLLVFDVSQGWKPLCDFLGLPVPAEPFPHLNDGQAVQVAFQRFAAGRSPEPA
ncbi:sulfotransferase family protein [Bailinhaonella thermotolerans]|uniref:Sulfotransferase family protein n=1 Tax=Bailinhaonella thermotolerans TaxID=1070861 RepID=A0A3A4A833_9ACTN|nr:sulfotransferase family protein [Bailinhaonella thermotolerans]RJL21220.1 sulfotransferase family protein [Bailinhaonella thermotolerans]